MKDYNCIISFALYIFQDTVYSAQSSRAVVYTDCFFVKE